MYHASQFLCLPRALPLQADGALPVLSADWEPKERPLSGASIWGECVFERPAIRSPGDFVSSQLPYYMNFTNTSATCAAAPAMGYAVDIASELTRSHCSAYRSTLFHLRSVGPRAP